MINNKKGFTLIELVMVIVIIAILAVAVNAILGDTTTSKVYGTARKIQSDLIYAQEQAMTHRIHYRVQFSAVPNGYTLVRCNFQTSPCPGWNPVIDPLTNTSPFAVTLNAGSYSGVSWTSNGFTGNYIEFNSAGVPLDGKPNPPSCLATPCPITITETVVLNGGIRSISVEPGTGKTRVF